MAEDLKPMLSKVLASAGKKRFYFAYGMGKRKDGKGDGSLLVDRKKLKPEQATDDLEKAQQMFAGTCWASPDGSTVYFAGKGKQLSSMIVAKMALTAKKEAGKQYDFQIPSPEEEARADGLADGEADGAAAAAGTVPPAPPPPAGAQTAGTPPAAPPPPAPPKGPQPGKPVDLQARLKSLVLRLKFVYGTAPALKPKLDPLFQSAVSLVQQGSADALPALNRLEAALNAVSPGGSLPDQAAAAPPPAAPPPPATAESTYLARVKALTEDLKKAIASGTEAGQEAKLRFSESQVFFRKKELPKATALLDVVEAQIKKALAGAAPAAGAVPKAPPPPAGAKAAAPGEGAVPKAPPPPAGQAAPANGDPAAQWKAKLAECAPAIKQALALKGPKAAAIAKLFAQASALAKPDGNMAQALATLTECHNLATAEISPKTGAAGEGQAPPAADPKSAAARWEAERATAVTKLEGEIKEILATEDPDASKAELELKAVMRQLKAKVETRQQAAEMERYLDQDDVVASVDKLAFPLKKTLLAVLRALAPLLPA